MKKKTFRSYLPWIILLLIAALLALLPRLARNSASGNQASVLSTVAERGTIESTLAGGGTLSAEEPVKLELPDSIEITEFLVENGDHVGEGQPVARVDPITLMTALTGVQDSLDSLATDILAESNSTKHVQYLTAKTAGRVKAIYATVGDDALNVMREHGALAVLSLDGMMVAAVETGRTVSPWQPVTVVRTDGSELPGQVESTLEGAVRVTLTDNGPRAGEQVTVQTTDGELLGEGVLEIHSPWSVLATDGTVSAVYASENDLIPAGNGIFQLQNIDDNAELRMLAEKRKEYEELIQKLFTLYGDYTLKAPASGYVSGIDKDLATNTAATDGGSSIRLLATVTAYGIVTGVGANSLDVVYEIPSDQDPSLMQLLMILSKGSEALDTTGMTMDFVPAVGDVIEIQVEDDGSGGTVTKLWHVEISNLLNDAGQGSPGGGAGTGGTGSAGGTGGLPSGYNYSGIDISSLMGASAGGSVSLPTTGTTAVTAATEDDGLFGLDERTLLSVTPDDAMTVEITVDELDILRYEPGMSADVTVDALPDRSFHATVTEIGGIGTNSGGSSKFSVTLRLDRAPDMLDGMNASVLIHRETREALLLPVAAITDRGSHSYVCTSMDSKTGKPTGEIEVELGISDGESVEILSGLKEGQTVWYEYYTGDGEDNMI